MIRGIVTDYREVVRLTVIGSRGRKRSIEAVIDTGYDGYLTLPPVLITRLALKWRRLAKSELADGNLTSFNVFGGTVLWAGIRRSIPIDESNSVPLLGMALLAEHLLQIHAWSGGSVLISHRK